MAGTTVAANVSDAFLASSSAIGSVAAKTCTVPADARCTTAALTAVFGRWPGIKAVCARSGGAALPSDHAPAPEMSPAAGRCSEGPDISPRRCPQAPARRLSADAVAAPARPAHAAQTATTSTS